MPLPSFALTGNLNDILPAVVAGEIGTSAWDRARVILTDNIKDGVLVWQGKVYNRPPTQILSVDTNGDISSVAHPVLLLANDPGLNVTGIQWNVRIESPRGTVVADFWIDAPGDGGTFNLGSGGIPSPGVAVNPAPPVFNVDSITDAGTTGKALMRATTQTTARDAIGAASTTDITNLIGAAPGTLDTLSEIADVFGDDPNALKGRDSDYVIWVSGSTYYATPRVGSGLALYSGTNFTTVLQNAITALTPSGANGSGGGKIHIAKGQYTFGNEVTITGWEGITGTSTNPASQLVIEGEGFATQLVQNTTGQNAFVVKNCANFLIKNLRANIGANAKSFLFGDKTGATSEMSCWKSKLDNLNIVSDSTTAAPIYLINFFDLDIPKLWVFASAFHGIILENDSTGTNYGNSHFGFIRSAGSTATPYAGLVLRSTNTSKWINMLTFDHYECNGTYYGMYAKGAQWCTFEFLDLEANQTNVFLDSGALGQETTRYFTVNSGYLLPRSGGVGVKNSVNSGGHKVRSVYVETASGQVAINDVAEYVPSNAYDVTVSDATAIANIAITASAKQQVRAEAVDGTLLDNRNPAALTHAASSKATPVDADEVPLIDSAASNVLKRLTWANLKAAIGTYVGAAALTLSNKTLTAPILANNDSIYDPFGNEVLQFATQTSAVNQLRIVNAPAGQDAFIDVQGTDTNRGININPVGTGTVKAGGVPVATTTGAQTLTQKTLTTPKIVNNDFIADGNGNAVIVAGQTASAVNQVKVSNAAAASGPTIAAQGTDTNVDLNLSGKNTGRVKVAGAPVGWDFTTTFVDVSMTGSPAQTIATGSFTRLNLNVEASDVGGNFDNATAYAYTIPTSGIYEFTALVRVNDGATSDFNLAIGVATGAFDGAWVKWNPVKTSSYGSRAAYDYIRRVMATAGQTYILYVFADAAASVGIKAAQMTAIRIA